MCAALAPDLLKSAGGTRRPGRTKLTVKLALAGPGTPQKGIQHALIKAGGIAHTSYKRLDTISRLMCRTSWWSLQD